MTLTPKKFYAYNRTHMEKLDSCMAFSRLAAAKIFAAKKQISLRDWLKIYVTHNCKDFDKLYGRNVYFRRNGTCVIQYKVLKGGLLTVQRFNISNISPNKLMTHKNFINFVKFMKSCGYDIDVDYYPLPNYII